MWIKIKEFFSALSVPDEGYSRNVLYALNLISTLFFYTKFCILISTIRN